MGTWDTGAFGNDTAADFVIDLEEAADLPAALAAALDLAGPTTELDADRGSEALVAAAVVAMAKAGEPFDEIDPDGAGAEVVEALPAHEAEKLVGVALNAVDRVATPPSELLDLWAEGAEGWKSDLEPIRAALRGAA